MEKTTIFGTLSLLSFIGIFFSIQGSGAGGYLFLLGIIFGLMYFWHC